MARISRMRDENFPAASLRVMRNAFTARGLALLVLCVCPLVASAQVTQSAVYQGRLTDANGVPQSGSVNLELRVYDDAGPGGSALYSEQHLNVPLSSAGVFSVALGDGTSATGSYDAALFSGSPRYLEALVEGQLMSPRQQIGSVPTALVAEQLLPASGRFEACDDGITVADHSTGLLWERKSGTLGSEVLCEVTVCADPHDVNNRYDFTIQGGGGVDPDGGVFTDFLAKLNDSSQPVTWVSASIDSFGDQEDGCFAGHCDWRVPAIPELATILVGADAAAGQASACASSPCIDPAFAAVGGPTASNVYRSASAGSAGTPIAWSADFSLGTVVPYNKGFSNFVRAVRAGTCTP